MGGQKFANFSPLQAYMPFNLALSNATVAEYLAWVRSALGESTYQNLLQSSPQALNFDRVISLEEQYLYGSKRLGVRRPGLEMARAAHNPSGYEVPVEPPSPTERFGNDCLCNERLPDDEEPYYPGAPFTARFYTHTLGMKEYEITNHLGNVLATVLDRKTGVKASPTATTYAWFKADVSTAQDYYPFGSHLPGRTYVAPTGAGYRFGFGGHEQVNVRNGNSSSYSTHHRFYDAQLGRWWSKDPEFKRYAGSSVYMAFGNNPNIVVDINGDTIFVIGTEDFQNATLASLRRLTNDKLELKNNMIVITAMGNQNPGKNLSYGTGLVRELSKKGLNSPSVRIEMAVGGNLTQAKSAMDEANLLVGKSGATRVFWHPRNMDGGIDINGNTERESFIGLAHELLHARNAYKGIMFKGGLYKPDGRKYIDPDPYSTKPLDTEEVNVRKEENIIRNENNIATRVIPTKIVQD